MCAVRICVLVLTDDYAASLDLFVCVCDVDTFSYISWFDLHYPNNRTVIAKSRHYARAKSKDQNDMAIWSKTYIYILILFVSLIHTTHTTHSWEHSENIIWRSCDRRAHVFQSSVSLPSVCFFLLLLLLLFIYIYLFNFGKQQWEFGNTIYITLNNKITNINVSLRWAWTLYVFDRQEKNRRVARKLRTNSLIVASNASLQQ